MASPTYPCYRCGSTDFEEVDAIWYCPNGHAQEGGQQVGEDDGDFGRFGRRTRQKQEQREEQKAVKVYRGSKGYQLFIKAWQHVLWRQCYALMHAHSLPTELWALVRELWALRLSKLTARLSDSTDLEPSETTQSSVVSDFESEIDDPEISERRTAKRLSDNPTLIDTIALNYLGILLLRHPTSLATVYRYVRREELCYIRAIRFVPKEIRDHLAPEYRLSLDTISIPTQNDLQMAVYRSAAIFSMGLGIRLPPINWTLMLLDHIRALALPIEIFPALRSLTEIVRYEFSYPRKLGQRRTATTFPEAQLISLVVVATKLCFPFDSDEIAHVVSSSTEPAALEMNWDVWLYARNMCDRQHEASSKRLSPEEAIDMTDRQILTMSEERLDEYMDWFQQTYAQDVKGNNIHKQILDMFPLQGVDRSADVIQDSERRSGLKRINASQAGLQSRPVQEIFESSGADREMRLGKAYPVYYSTRDMPEAALAFHQDAARLACLDVDALIRACLRTETLLLRNEHELRRSKYFSET